MLFNDNTSVIQDLLHFEVFSVRQNYEIESYFLAYLKRENKVIIEFVLFHFEMNNKLISVSCTFKRTFLRSTEMLG